VGLDPTDPTNPTNIFHNVKWNNQQICISKGKRESENERQAIMPASKLPRHTRGIEENIQMGIVEISRNW